jgi:hypothetical protein
MTDFSLSAIKNTLEVNLIILNLSLAKNFRELFEMWEGDTELIKSWITSNPDDESMAIVKASWNELNQRRE